ncbi:MAG TPA: hypothetical protein VFQ39_08705 [Longimicrobium sp.]|nr:hypothetical protein [Longimicrobium sp.]
MTTRSIFRAAVAGAALALVVSTDAHAQLGSLRRAAQRAAAGAAGSSAPAAAASPTTAPASASSRVNTGDVLEMTAPVLDRFERALAAESADLAQLAQRIAAVKTPEQHSQCTVTWVQSAEGQAMYEKLNAASSGSDPSRMTALAEEIKGAMEKACGPDPSERQRIQNDAPAHAQEAAVAAGEFNARQYAVLKERVVPFCRNAAAAEAGGDVQLPGSGRNVFWVYTAAEAEALRGRCAALMQSLQKSS